MSDAILRIHHVVAGIGQEASGLSYAVPSLCAALAALNHEVFLNVLEPLPDSRTYSFQVNAFPCQGLRRLGVSGQMRSALRELGATADIMHSHGLWMMPNIYAGEAARGRAGCHFVVSPDGMLEPWAMHHHRFRKQVMWLWRQKASLRSAACFHASTEWEYRSIRALGFTAPVMVIPYGIEIPDGQYPPERASGPRRLLYLARIHRLKGLDRLIRAWCLVQDRFRDWEFEIVGKDERGYEAKMQRLADTLGARRVRFRGTIPNTEKSSCYRAADLYILPSHSESWGVSVAEALAHGVPVIVSRAAPWAGILDHDCGWWIDNSVDSIAECLTTALALPPHELRDRGRRGRAWMRDDYSWAAVARRTAQGYRWLLERGEAPDFVFVE